MFMIDGESYNIGAVSIKRDAPFLDKYANRTEDGNLQRDLIGVYYNYTLTFPKINNPSEYNRLYKKVTEPVPYHTVTVPDCIGSITYTAYISAVSDELHRIKDGQNLWGGLTIKFIAKSPNRRL